MKPRAQLDMFATPEPVRPRFVPHPDEWREVWLEEQTAGVDLAELRGVKRSEET